MSVDNNVSLDSQKKDVSSLNAGSLQETLKNKLTAGNYRDSKSNKLYGEYYLPRYREIAQEAGVVDSNQLKEKAPGVYDEIVEATVTSFTRGNPEDIVKEVAKDMKENPDYYSPEYKQDILNKSFATLALEARKHEVPITLDWKDTIFNTRMTMGMTDEQRNQAFDFVLKAFSAEEDANEYKVHVQKVPDLVSVLAQGSEDPMFDKAKKYLADRSKVLGEGDSVGSDRVRFAEYADEALGVLKENIAKVEAEKK